LGPAFAITREGGAWRVSGISAERAVAFADLTKMEAADMAARRLSRLGVDEALAEAGAEEGDEVRIGELAFEFYVDHSSEEE
jgi:GTP-binding protein